MQRLGDVEVHVLLESTAQSEVGSKQDYYRAVQEAYTTQYLQALGIEPKEDYKKLVARQAPLGECDIEATWDDHNGRSALASHLRILQPILGKGSAPTAAETASKAYAGNQEHGISGHISVAVPNVPAGSPSLSGGHGRGTSSSIAWGSTASHHVDFMKASKTLDDKFDGMDINGKLVQELEQARRQARGDDVREAAENAKCQKWGADGAKELENLKRKFVLPFAMQRPKNPGSALRLADGGSSHLLPWQSPELQEACDIQVPAHLVEDILRPIQMTLPDIAAEAADYAQRLLPLELLTTRTDPGVFAIVRKSLQTPEMTRMVGLLAHLLYWTVFGHVHKSTEQLPQTTRQSLILSVQALWSALVEPARQKIRYDVDSVVCFLLPVHMLAAKRGVEHVFLSQYPLVFGDLDNGARLQLAVVDQLNVLMMNILDPDCAFASFGALDSSIEAIRLWRKLGLKQVKLGLSPPARILGRELRTTPMMTLLMKGDGGEPVCAKTRMLLQRSTSDAVLAAISGQRPPKGTPSRNRSPRASPRNGKVKPQLDDQRRIAVYRTTCKRLAFSGHQVVNGSGSSSSPSLQVLSSAMSQPQIA